MERKQYVSNECSREIKDINYDEVYAYVICIKIIRLLIAIAAQSKWKVFQLDVKCDGFHVLKLVDSKCK